MLHITWVHWVSASIVPVKDAPKKNPTSLHFQGRETDQSVMLRCGLVFVIIWDLIIKQLLYLIESIFSDKTSSMHSAAERDDIKRATADSYGLFK